MEAVEDPYLESVRITPDIDAGDIEIEYSINRSEPSEEADKQLEIEVSLDGERIALDSDIVHLTQRQAYRRIALPGFSAKNLWSPESPVLYHIVFRIKHGNRVMDEVKSYFGMRKISVKDGDVMLNNTPLYVKLVLDQGYFPEGMLAAPCDDDFKRDIELTKAMGFNGVRKHQKVEDPRYLYWADRLGLLV